MMESKNLFSKSWSEGPITYGLTYFGTPLAIFEVLQELQAVSKWPQRSQAGIRERCKRWVKIIVHDGKRLPVIDAYGATPQMIV